MFSKHFHVPILLFLIGAVLTLGGGYSPGFDEESEVYDPELEAALADMDSDLDLAWGEVDLEDKEEYGYEEEEYYEDEEEGVQLGMVADVIGMLVVVAVRVGLGLLACFVTGKIMVFDFTPMLSSVVKLAAIFVFPSAVASYIPYAGFGVQFLLYYLLLSWLFEVSGTELHVFAGVIFMVNMLATVVATMLVAGLIIGF